MFWLHLEYRLGWVEEMKVILGRIPYPVLLILIHTLCSGMTGTGLLVGESRSREEGVYDACEKGEGRKGSSWGKQLTCCYQLVG